MNHRAIMQGVIVRIAVGVFGLLTVGLLLLAVFNEKGALAVSAQSSMLRKIQKDNQSLESENKSLNNEIHSLQTDPAAIEKQAREKQGLVRKDEIILVIPDDSTPGHN